MDNFIPDEMRCDLIKHLNIINSEFDQWTIRRAQKNHIDLFGKEIEQGDYYYRLRIDTDFCNDIKMTTYSMELFLFAIFAPSPKWIYDLARYENMILKDKLDSKEKNRDLMDKIKVGTGERDNVWEGESG